ncbi:DUF2164 family protein [Alicyclobacillaceae bacterium I2511]|nr:DUF2164 family protein [Alicyclobacillaceae bacterium I2511]
MDVVKIPREDKLQIVEQIQSYLENERSENIGNLVAEGLLDMIESHIAPYIYQTRRKTPTSVLGI